MYPPAQTAYDRAIVVFSPDGRLFQVEYAREAIRMGSTSIALVCKDGIVFVGHKRLLSPLMVGESQEKIFQIDVHCAAISSGFAGDARKLVDFARLEAQKHRLVYEAAIPTALLVKQIGDLIQFFTQYAGVRPFGAALLVGGVDTDGACRVFETDPSGALFEFKATAIGAGRKTVEELFEKEYKETLSIEEGIKLALKALRKAVEEKLTPENVAIAIIDKKTARYRALTREEVAPYLEK